jgi:DNA mismatch endonuclease (patch repair protein)
MADVHTIEIRSKNMSAIKSRGNLSTEVRLLKLLKANHITGWRRHSKRITGRPDYSFSAHKVAVFLDGCFWHKCPVCFRSPKTNTDFWINKINANVERDSRIRDKLKGNGWVVFQVWEHQLKKEPEIVVATLKSVLTSSKV